MFEIDGELYDDGPYEDIQVDSPLSNDEVNLENNYELSTPDFIIMHEVEVLLETNQETIT